MECTVRLGRGTGASVREDVGLAFGGVRSEALREGLLSAKNLGATAHSGSTGGQRHPSSIRGEAALSAMAPSAGRFCASTSLRPINVSSRSGPGRFA